MCLEILCCCLGPAACGLCCGGCGGKAKSSVLTRLMYLTFLVAIVLVSAILLAPDVQEALENAVRKERGRKKEGGTCGEGGKTRDIASKTIPFVVGTGVQASMLSMIRSAFLFPAQDILCVDYNRTLGPGDVKVWVVRIPLPEPGVSQDRLLNCARFIGYLAVYRICMAVASFFFLMMLITLCVFSSKDPRAYIQNG